MQYCLFFYCSPLGVLEVQLKNNKVYAISKANISYNKIKKLYPLKRKDLIDIKKQWKSMAQVLYGVSKGGNTISRVFFKTELSQIRKNEKTGELVQKLIIFLDNYFLKKEMQQQNFSLFPRGTVFQKKVWRVLKKISYGQTSTYAEIAKVVGSPGAARAVGSACARNPYLILVPCHRVVAQKGLGGFALGLPAKELLLNHERSFLRIN